jgi:hypothetical protein
MHVVQTVGNISSMMRITGSSALIVEQQVTATKLVRGHIGSFTRGIAKYSN